MCKSCSSCNRWKPNFYKPPSGKLIRATQAFERISIDFKGPLPASKLSGNKFILTVIDEFSRFPFAFVCKDTSSQSAIRCLMELFTTYGVPGTIHSDNGPAFVSKQMKEFYHRHGINASTTSMYNPQGNGQVERLNGTIWKAVTLYADSHGLHISEWESILPLALHSIRTLLCTATNVTPHERFFTFARRSIFGEKQLPTWLCEEGPVLWRNFNRNSKNDPIAKEVTLISSNPNYALISDDRGLRRRCHNVI